VRNFGPGSAFRDQDGTLALGYDLSQRWRTSLEGRYGHFFVEDPGTVQAPLSGNWSRVGRGGFSWDLDNTGIGLLEHSHRGSAFMHVIEHAESQLRQLAGIPDDYVVLFMPGGASSQFFMVPMSFLPAGGTADYCVTGVWSQKAVAEAKRFGNVHIACTGEADSFRYIPAPDQIRWSSSPSYAHFTSNNTVYGTQWPTEPPARPGVPLVCDASSDLFSRPIDVSKYALIYAGAQKNLGPAGVTIVIARRDFLERGRRDLPTMLQYRTFVAEQSMFNTPPTFAIYVVGEVVAWLLAQGGLPAIAERNRTKAAVLYDHLDQSALFRSTVRADSRSLMNVTFRATTEVLENEFITAATARGLDGLRGHRLVGGMRASLYNALPIEAVQALVAFMKEFELDHRSAA
jgi:phosphoserine aminotransferase